MNEHRIHQIFQISVILKGIDAVIECVGGLALAVIGTGTILSLVDFVTRAELSEDPHDFVSSHLLDYAQHFSVGTKNFYAIYLLGHGLVKILLVVGLLRKKLWAYPASLVVLGLFIAYQLYRLTQAISIVLIGLTLLDVVVIVLVWHEYGLMRRHLPTS